MPAGWGWPNIESSSASSQTRVHYYRPITSLQHDPSELLPDHPGSPARLLAIETAMARVDWLGCAVHPAPEAPERELELVHSPAHVRRIREICARGGRHGWLGGGAGWGSPGGRLPPRRAG